METPTKKVFKFVESLVTLGRVLTTSHFKSGFLKVNHNEKIHILGNGPSLQEVDLNILDGDLMAVNNFALTEKFEVSKPKYYILNAPEYWIADVDSEYIELRQKLTKAIDSKTLWPMSIYLPFGAKNSDFCEGLQKIKNIEVIFYNTTPVEGYSWLTFRIFDAKLGMPRPHNILIPAIMTSLWMGYKKIFIYGADHSWLSEIFVGENNNVYLTQKHFYDTQTAKPDVMKKLGKNQRRLHEVLEKFYLTFKGYHEIRSYAISRNCQIINYTRNSFIDAFDKK